MTFIVERLVELRRHLDYLVELDLSLAVEALERLEVVRRFVRLVADLEERAPEQC